MRIGGVDFPERLLNALQHGRLVIFAGAGVSMGPPANLPSFKRLAELVAEGTGQSMVRGETEDRFLGRLQDRGTNVHERAAEILRQGAGTPTPLHGYLLRCYARPEEVQLVTTNFDTLFESAATGEFDFNPQVFQAPVLPLGSRFQGIVHLHGSVDEPTEAVLTHRDFGRAYLTEADGWARRFLVDLFANYTVLFVGYSHSDTIMTYLTPSLSPDDEPRRFALMGDKTDTPERWLRLGVQPAVFRQENAEDFSELDVAVRALADHVRRGYLGWQREVEAIAGRRPPIVDDEHSGFIEHALTRPDLTQFFVDVATLPEWIEWLEQRGHLDALFAPEDLNRQSMMLSHWLATGFAVQHSNELFSLIARHGGRVNWELWQKLAWAVGSDTGDSPLETATLAKWVHFLTGYVPQDLTQRQIGELLLRQLGETCARLRAPQNLLQVYSAMNRVGRGGRLGTTWSFVPEDQYEMQQLWENSLEPHLDEIAHSLLNRTTVLLEERHSFLSAWGQANETWDTDSDWRSAIEPHSQDERPWDMSALIDIARGCLEWLAVNDPATAGTWCNQCVSSDAPLLRRLAIHAMSARDDLSADDKIAWMIERCDVNEVAIHHEIFRAAAATYPQASPQRRKDFIDAVSKYEAPRSERDDPLQ